MIGSGAEVLFSFLLVFGGSLYASESIQRRDDTHSYCDGDRFEARCSPGDVIHIQTAVYGRMHLGRCVKVDLGYLGCSENVLDVLAPRCSGRESCDFVVSHKTFPAFKACFEVRAYLEISYKCIPVVRLDSELCHYRHTIRLTEPRGTIPAPFHYRSIPGCSAVNIWVVEGLPGQRINLTLMDFGADPERTSLDRKHWSAAGEACRALYVTVIESTPVERSERVCGWETNSERNVYLSSGSKVQIHVNDQNIHQQYFLLNYQLVGCADFEPSVNMWFKRNGNEAEIGCRDSSNTWTLRCINGKWESDFENCSVSAGSSAWEGHIGHRLGNIPKNIITVVTCFVAFVVGSVIIVVGVLIYRRNRRRSRRHELLSLSLSGAHGRHNQPSEVALSKIEMLEFSDAQRRGQYVVDADDVIVTRDDIIVNRVTVPCVGIGSGGGHVVGMSGWSYEAAGMGGGSDGGGTEYYTRVSGGSTAADGGHCLSSPTNFTGSGNKYAHIWEMPLPVPDE